MTVDYVKLLELVAIETNNEKSYLRIKLSSEQQIELFWEIDSITATNINTIYEHDGNHKYRLSLHTTFDTSKDLFVSSITKTYRDLSERIYFTCSMDYKNCLQSIKNSDSTDLNKLPFISMKLSLIDETKIIKKIEQDEVGNVKGHNATYKWLITSISVIFVVMFVYVNYYSGKTTLNSTVVVASNIEDKLTSVDFNNEKNNVTSSSILVNNDSAPISLPYIKIDESITYSIPEGYVALTFDDGPSKYTMTITDILKQYNVGGTFFFLGINAKKHPDSVRYVLSNGYSIGSHSMNHFVMTELSTKELEDELLQSTEAIENITKEKVALFRPPYGEFDEQVEDAIRKHRYNIVLWNKDSEDWKTQDSDKIYNYVRDNEASGSIIIFHESQNVIDALPRIIENLQDQNLKIVNLQ